MGGRDYDPAVDHLRPGRRLTLFEGPGKASAAQHDDSADKTAELAGFKKLGNIWETNRSAEAEPGYAVLTAMENPRHSFVTDCAKSCQGGVVG
jgi:hypothetical protein